MPRRRNVPSTSAISVSPRISAVERDEGAAPLGVPAREPMRNAQEARPPECARLGKILERGKVRLAECDEFVQRIGGKAGREILRECADGGMNNGAAFGGAGLGVDRIERL